MDWMYEIVFNDYHGSWKLKNKNIKKDAFKKRAASAVSALKNDKNSWKNNIF